MYKRWTKNDLEKPFEILFKEREREKILYMAEQDEELPAVAEAILQGMKNFIRFLIRERLLQCS